MIKTAVPYLTYLILSILIILFSQYTREAGSFIVDFYNYVDGHIEIFFSRSPGGIALRHIVALVVCPLIISGIPAMIYHAVKHSAMPYFMQITWLLWIVIALSTVLVR